MKNYSLNTITIGNQTYNRSDLIDYLQTNRIHELTEKLLNETQLSPEEVKSQISILEKTSIKENDEIASIEYKDNIYTFKYTNPKGEQYIVGPKDIYWERVQELLQEDLLYKKFKKEYDLYRNKRIKRKRNNIITIVVIGVALLLLWAFFLDIF